MNRIKDIYQSDCDKDVVSEKQVDDFIAKLKDNVLDDEKTDNVIFADNSFSHELNNRINLDNKNNSFRAKWISRLVAITAIAIVVSCVLIIVKKNGMQHSGSSVANNSSSVDEDFDRNDFYDFCDKYFEQDDVETPNSDETYHAFKYEEYCKFRDYCYTYKNAKNYNGSLESFDEEIDEYYTKCRNFICKEEYMKGDHFPYAEFYNYCEKFFDNKSIRGGKLNATEVKYNEFVLYCNKFEGKELYSFEDGFNIEVLAIFCKEYGFYYDDTDVPKWVKDKYNEFNKNSNEKPDLNYMTE